MTANQVIDQIKEFNKNEFLPGKLELTDANVLLNLRKLRLDWGQPIHPSRHDHGLARTNPQFKNSQHYAVGRLSTAIDFFPTGNVIAFWEMCKQYSFIGGLGIYFDTNRSNLQPGPMIHIDLRPNRILWVRIYRKYIYLNNQTSLSDWILLYDEISKYLKSL